MEKKGEYEESGFSFLKNASERELFYLSSGLTISCIRDLLVQVRNMNDESFSYYVTTSNNIFSDWFKNVLKDSELSVNVKNEKSKDFFIKIVNNRLCDLELKKLKRFGVEISKDKLLIGEELIQEQLRKGFPNFVIQKNLLDDGWSSKIVDLIFEDNSLFYKNFTSLSGLFKVNYAQIKFDELKKNIINAVADGLTLSDIVSYLQNQGWPKNILAFMFNFVYKPKLNVTKVSWFLTKEIGDKNKSISAVKNSLDKSNLKEYFIDHLIHGFHSFDNDLIELINHVNSFDNEEKNRITAFFKKTGWDESFINQAIKNRELKTFWIYISKSLGVDDWNILKFNTEIFKDNILKFKFSSDANSLWNNILSNYKKINISSFADNNGELHFDKEYVYYYPGEDVSILINLSKKGLLSLIPGSSASFYYSTPIKPLLCEVGKNKFLISSKIIEKVCLSCKASFPVTKMSKLDIWNSSRTYKTTKYVCKQHEKLVKTLIDETRIVQ